MGKVTHPVIQALTEGWSSLSENASGSRVFSNFLQCRCELELQTQRLGSGRISNRDLVFLSLILYILWFNLWFFCFSANYSSLLPATCLIIFAFYTRIANRVSLFSSAFKGKFKSYCILFYELISAKRGKMESVEFQCTVTWVKHVLQDIIYYWCFMVFIGFYWGKLLWKPYYKAA